MSMDLINIIFGMKVRQARLEAGLTLTDLARQAEMSPSYLTEIEKGRKYPRADKIVKMAEALGKPYDDLVSIRLAPSLRYLESTPRPRRQCSASRSRSSAWSRPTRWG
jgi:transcriptional regulator with XRE-family HTH domain